MPRSLLLGLLGLSLSASFLLGLPGAAGAQPTRMLEEFQFGEDSLVARLLFFESKGEEGLELCAAIGTRRGPRSINKGHVFVTRRVRPDDRALSGRLKFKFGKKPDAVEGNLQVWHSCVPSEGAPEGVEEDVLEITVRGGQENHNHSRFFAPYPAKDGAATGVQIQFNNVGGLAGGFFEKKLDPENHWDLSLDLPPEGAG